MISELFPKDWLPIVQDEFNKDYFQKLEKFIDEEYSTQEVFPPREQLFRAFELCSLHDIKVVIVGQDPYHGDGQANGLSFSVARDVALPPSLKNIFKEVAACGYTQEPENGELERWARQGVLMINSVLSVRAHAAASHGGKGWEKFTDAILKAISEQCDSVVFMLWGGYASKKAKLIDQSKHKVLTGVHPSPLSSYRGWFGCAHFSTANDYLMQSGRQIIW